MLNIIGDIAGQYRTLMALVEKMPEGKTVLVGDMIDRGRDSRKVVEWAMKTPDVIALMGNHELMCLQYHGNDDQWKNWIRNGGGATLDSYRDPDGVPCIPLEHLMWMAKLPLYFETEDLVITHAPLDLGVELLKDAANDIEYFTWNRASPRREAKYQVFGHNSHMGLKYFDDEQGQFATCIDTSASRVLTGMHWPSRTIYQQTYLD